jgi:signal transduction histidine kinase
VYIGIFYYLYNVASVSLFWSGSVVLILVFFSGYLISKLATQPLIAYINDLQTLSSQTLHELNLPIATIKTNSAMIKRKADDPKLIKRLERIEDATNMLQERYNELDYLIKTQTKKQIKEQFDVAKLIQKRLDFLQNLYPSHIFQTALEETIIVNDPFGLSKAFDNLIDNAVKYSSKKSKITVGLQNNTLCICDEGEGIDEVELIRIFDRYYQGNPSKKGFGIGLYVVKSFCDANNIELTIQSKKNSGTTVELKFKG